MIKLGYLRYSSLQTCIISLGWGHLNSSTYFEIYSELLLTIVTLLYYCTLELIPSNRVFVPINQPYFISPCPTLNLSQPLLIIILFCLTEINVWFLATI